MRRLLASLGLSTGLMALAAVGAAAHDKAAEATRSGVRALLDAQVEAWNRGDLEGFMAGYWRSPELSFYSGGTVTKGWQATIERYRARYQSEGREMGRLAFEAIEVLTLGADAAMARGGYRLQMKDGSSPHGLFTLLLKREDGAWRIVHDHTSSPE
jgi:beta-aspartyl-peptidase (threonine type)